MSIFQALILGVVQGITEFLPISSSGHLIFFPVLFGWEEHGPDFDVMIHLATLMAILWAMRNDVTAVLVDAKKHLRTSVGLKIVLATVPAVMFGLWLSDDHLSSTRTVTVVAVSLIIWGAVLSAADVYAGRVRAKTTDAKKTSWKQALVIGVAQALALIPGTSRSGITMTAALFSGQDRETAARFSFLLAIPIMAGAGVFAIKDAIEMGGFSTSWQALIVGFVAALVSGTVSIKFLLKFLEKANFQWFAAYRIFLGLFILLFLT